MRGRREKAIAGRNTRQWKKWEESSQVSMVRESIEIAEVMPIFANGVFGEMQIRYPFVR